MCRPLYVMAVVCTAVAQHLYCGCVFQRLVMSQTLAAGIVLTCGWLYFSMFLPSGDTRLNQLGFTCSVVTVSMYLSPLSSLVQLPFITNTARTQHIANGSYAAIKRYRNSEQDVEFNRTVVVNSICHTHTNDWLLKLFSTRVFSFCKRHRTSRNTQYSVHTAVGLFQRHFWPCAWTELNWCPDYKQHLLSNSANAACAAFFLHGGINCLFSPFPFVSLSHLVFSPSTILFVSLPPSASKRQCPPPESVSCLSSFICLFLLFSASVCLCLVTFCLRDFIVGSQKHQVKMTPSVKLPSWRLSLSKHCVHACGFKREKSCPCSLSNLYWIFRYIVNINIYLKRKDTGLTT